MIKKILVIKLKNIGDVVLTTPALRALRKSFPHAYIAILVRKGTEEILAGLPYFDEIIELDIDGAHSIRHIGGNIRFLYDLRKKGFDLSIDLSGGGDRGAALSFFSGARLRVGYDPQGKGMWGKRFLYTRLIKPANIREHVIDYNLRLIDYVTESHTNNKIPEIFVSDEDINFVKKIVSVNGLNDYDGIVTIHPTSRWLFKCWRNEGMAEAADYIATKYNYKVVLTSGPDTKERDVIKRILSLMKTSPLDLSGQLSLKQLAALIKMSKLFIGVDSAPMHIASGVCTPIIALFGPTGWWAWGPFGEHDIVLHKELPCQPCGKDGCNGSKRSRCLEEISTDEVIKAVDRQLQNVHLTKSPI
ncbi:MAG: putative lipopolysaccharide heptosyltransferase III [Candidatus Omnitrophica bacterium]|nr:putative lipopolysaccharide heptosyltransferase III [Candidatus Omnitrophota bacterium]